MPQETDEKATDSEVPDEKNIALTERCNVLRVSRGEYGDSHGTDENIGPEVVEGKAHQEPTDGTMLHY